MFASRSDMPELLNADTPLNMPNYHGSIPFCRAVSGWLLAIQAPKAMHPRNCHRKKHSGTMRARILIRLWSPQGADPPRGTVLKLLCLRRSRSSGAIAAAWMRHAGGTTGAARPSLPHPLALGSDGGLKALLKHVQAGSDCLDGNPYRAAEQNEQEQKELLPGGHLAEVHRVQSCLGHGGHGQEKAVEIADAERGFRRDIVWSRDPDLPFVNGSCEAGDEAATRGFTRCRGCIMRNS
ncbi:hypothetical protein B0T10DRAFT_467341 [Thelonectria olida]|uniref:Uncharacterized protein n=1 Tax=Thelonectria olida TaxID=1576542 RepID=A0A9P8VQ49_9HYPO|nr:hypothetical protein B0T10DRAFT_467341 [Thelonectria olida]